MILIDDMDKKAHGLKTKTNKNEKVGIPQEMYCIDSYVLADAEASYSLNNHTGRHSVWL